MKTLKDLKQRLSDYTNAIFKGDDVISGHTYWYEQNELKEAAIEWVKDKEEFIEALQNKDTLYIEPITRAEAIIDWIKHFFNLTDEEIKARMEEE